MTIGRRMVLGGASAAWALAASPPSFARKQYDDGATDREIKIGNTNPYSGPGSSYGVIGKGIDAYWKMVNDRGGISGRMIRFVSLDDGYSPPKTVEMVRQLVEQDKVLCLFNPLGAAPNTAIRKYLNQKKVPQLFVASGASKWGDVFHFPWTMGFQPDFRTEAIIYARHVLSTVKDARIGVLMHNDDYGKDYWEGFKEGLGKNADLVVKHTSYEMSDPTVDSQIIQLKDSGANVFFNIALPKFAAQAIRKAAEIGWKPIHYLNNVSSSVASTFKPAGYENGQGIITGLWMKDPTDRQWKDDAAMKAWRDWMATYLPGANQDDSNYVYAYAASFLMEQTLRKCGDDLTRENVMRQAANFQKLRVPVLLPGVTVSTSPTDFYPVQAVQLARFKGETWERFGEVISAEES
ncbi:amino acid/amide ABC transporter substrate-binding protein, HAAT family (TC 3.A.1.4.-) [Enhydrobacter aerosaccus]|uniref:Amino acid/amide ABC transporter substrate-binding protein, HAAT family (TC 3.A.1.4.-) n=1 Tax=Enhydrobacter aerosaccus TaxID=225324 RepID=A0A1T4TN09_9HYPH|nr:ABC transporter substrate-binding protein [Enhydrobacter aerosaccus]SKA41787.1 amino acid/amide ABC transporter substrate-binding protein, HAAT family (TC 3.A.1.4.-) [Enhydrobacter aerosaccus]